MTRGESFEKTWIENDNIRSQIVSPGNLSAVKGGFCAPEKKVHVFVDSNNNYVGIGGSGVSQFKCGGTCNPSTGKCDYESLNGDCYCDADNACKGVKASQLFEGFNDGKTFGTPGKGKFVCVGSTACDHTCGLQNEESAAESCYCQVHNGGFGRFDYLKNHFKNFFDSTYFESNNGDFCCENIKIPINIYKKTDHYIVRDTIINVPNTCAAGFLKGNNTVFDSSYPLLVGSMGDRKVLSCNGDLVYCCGETTDGCEPPYEGMLKATTTLSLNTCSRSCSSDGQWSLLNSHH